MDVRELPPGEAAPEGSDRVTINVLPNGKAGFTSTHQAGSVQAHGIHENIFPTEAAAIEAALRWAEECRIEVLYVERPSP
ncbi:MAG TPA: hypothetical protein VFZ91_14405 [Allosphingosinicella sp.]